MAPRTAMAPQTRKRTRGAKDVKYRFVVKQRQGSRWSISPRAGHKRVLGMHDDAKGAAEAAAAVWNVPLSSLVKTNGKASRPWKATHFQWIWQRGIDKFVLRRRWEGEDFVLCSANLEELVAKAMAKWKLTRAELTKAHVSADDAGGTTQPSGGAEEEEVPATQPYPVDVLSVLEGTPEEQASAAVLEVGEPPCHARQEQALADLAEEEGGSDDDSCLPANVNWGAAKFVAATLAADPSMLPGDIADLENRATGRTLQTCRHFACRRPLVICLSSAGVDLWAVSFGAGGRL
jgi:hypothetical protein